MKRKGPKTVDEYVANQPQPMRGILKDLRRAIKEAAPSAEETISYQMPAYKHNGVLVFFAGFKEHMSLFVPSQPTLKRFRKRLEPYAVSGATIRFTVEKPLPLSLVEAIVRSRVKENEIRSGRKRRGTRSTR